MSGEIKIRVRFNETDAMKYLYHGNYASYYHLSRTELLRRLGLCDKSMEAKGIILPVIDLQCKYLKPAFYDDELMVRTQLSELSACKLCFEHEVYNEDNELINSGFTAVAYVNSESRKPVRIPKEIEEKLKYLINKK